MTTHARVAPRAEVTVQVTSRSLKRRRRNTQYDNARAVAAGTSTGAHRDKTSATRDIDLEAAFDLRERGEFVETRRDELIRKGLLHLLRLLRDSSAKRLPSYLRRQSLTCTLASRFQSCGRSAMSHFEAGFLSLSVLVYRLSMRNRSFSFTF